MAPQPPNAAGAFRAVLRTVSVIHSRKVVVALLAVLVALCVVSVVLPQQGSPGFEEWQERSPALARAARLTGLDNVFVSAPFLALLLISALSLTVSIATRAAALWPRGEVGLWAHLWARRRLVGSLIFHAGLVGLLITGALSAATRAEGRLDITEGQTVTIDEALLTQTRAPRYRWGVPTSFRVRFEEFHPIHEGSWGTPDYASDLTVIEGPRVVQRATVRVNEPLVHAGVTAYYMLHGFSTRIVVTRPGLRAPFNNWVALGTDLTSEPVRYRDTFAIPGTEMTVEAELFPDAYEKDGRLATRSPNATNPVLFLVVRDGVDTVYEGRVYLSKPVELLGGGRLSFEGVRYWSGFQTVCDRGIGALFVCSWIAVVGLCIRFLPLRAARGGS